MIFRTFFLLFTASVRSRPPGPPAVPGVYYNKGFLYYTWTQNRCKYSSWKNIQNCFVILSVKHFLSVTGIKVAQITLCQSLKESALCLQTGTNVYFIQYYILYTLELENFCLLFYLWPSSFYYSPHSGLLGVLLIIFGQK